MIFANVNVTIKETESVCDHPILLYRGDKNVQIRFILHGNKFVVQQNTYAQLIINRPTAPSLFTDPYLIEGNTVTMTITEDMIDELTEIGTYQFQIRLFDDNLNAQVTLPPCYSGLIIERPIAVEGESLINRARINDAIVFASNEYEDIFDEDNLYIRTNWRDGDLISDSKMNKIEEAIYELSGRETGGGGATAPYISTSLPENNILGLGEVFKLHLDFSSPAMGRGKLKVFINDKESMSANIQQGENTIDILDTLFSKGNNRLTVYVIDRTGVMSNSLTFYVRYGSLEISSDFDPYISYDQGSIIRYYFTPTSVDTSLTLTMYMNIDGKTGDGVACYSDTRGYFTFPNNLEVGSHRCQAYIKDSAGTTSNVLTFNLVILDNESLVIASDTLDPVSEEGAQLSLDYKVYSKNETSFITKTYIDGNLVNTGNCGLDFNYYKTASLSEGVHSIKVEVYNITETMSDYIIWTVTITASEYDMLEPISTGSLFIASAMNMSNVSENKEIWKGVDQDGNQINGNLYDFSFNSQNGWVDDELLITGNSRVEIPISPLSDNAKYGFTLDLEFASKMIGVDDALVLNLWDDTKDCGIKITTEKVILRSAEGNQCDLYFTDDEMASVIFVIDRNEATAKIYLNGVMCSAFHLSDYVVDGVSYLEDFTVDSNIVLGGSGHTRIRNLRVYQIALTTDEILNNFMANEKDKSKQKELVKFQKGEHLPTLTIYCDFSGLGKDDKKPCSITYVSTDEEKYGKSFTLTHKKSTCQYQGTSSMAYPIKNYRINLADENGEKLKYEFPFGQPEHRYTLKADFMSSGHWTNTGLTKWINNNLYNYDEDDEKSMNPKKWYDINNGGKLSDTRECIYGFPCRLILVNDGDTPLNEGQNEPTPGNTKDMGIFNFNHDKDATDTMGFDDDVFPNCASYEVTANSDTSAGAFISYIDSKNIFKHENAFDSSVTVDVNLPCEIQTYNGEKVYRASGSTAGNSAFKILNCFKENTVYTLQFDPIIPDSIGWAQVNIRYTDGGLQSLQYKDVVKPVITSNTDRTIEQIYFTNPNSSYIRADSIVLLEGEIPEDGGAEELEYIKQSFELRFPDEDDVAEDWGFMGVEAQVMNIASVVRGGARKTSMIKSDYFGDIVELQDIEMVDESQPIFLYSDGKHASVYKSALPVVMTINDPTYDIAFGSYDMNISSLTINGVKYYLEGECDLDEVKDPYEATRLDTSYGLKVLIDWVDNCTDEEFVRDFEQHFNKDYTLRYFLLVITLGMVDNLGKNMMLDTWDNKIFMPRFYDCDTICSYDNSGQLKFDVDIEMAQGYWNTSTSRLWTRIRDLMHDDLVAKYNSMRQNGLSYESLMQCFYDEQIAKIPQKYYNMDYDVKYAPFADSYLGMANGDTYEHLKRWLKQRLIFVDTLYDYAPSYNNDVLTIRANTTELMRLEIETYTPVYQHLSWYNNQMDKKKIDGKIAVEFTGTAMAATDQEVLIYGGSNIKSIKGISSMNPNRMLIGSATRLIELDAPNCPLLSDINANKSNLAPHVYLNKVNLSGCPLLGGNLIINNSPLVREIDIRGTGITGLNLPSSLRNLETLKLPNAIKTINLNDASQLHTLEFDEGVKMETVSMSNCNALTNVVNFDLENVTNVTLNNSYNIANELYFSKTTNLSLRNMSNLERVIYTPNAEYEVFDKSNVDNASDYKVSVFNSPKCNTFVVTAPYRESYKKDYGEVKPDEVFIANSIDISDTIFTDVKLLATTDANMLKLPSTTKNIIVDSAYDLDTEYLTDGDYDTIHTDLYEPYNTDYEDAVSVLTGEMILKNLDKSIDFTDNYTEYFEVMPGTEVYITNNNIFDAHITQVKIYEYDKDKVEIKVTDKWGHLTDENNAWVLGETTQYIRVWLLKTGTFTLNYYGRNYNLNLVPSASDGSLIFSMYAPNNTTEPASGTWDMNGLEISTIHTFGLNNDVKQIYGYIEKNIVIEGKDLNWEVSWGVRSHTFISNNGFKSITPLESTNNVFHFFDKDGNVIESYSSITSGTEVTIPENTHKIETECYTNETGIMKYDVVYYELGITQIQMPNRVDDYSYNVDNLVLKGEVMQYTATAQNAFPTFNSDFEYDYTITPRDGEYLYRIVSKNDTSLTSMNCENSTIQKTITSVEYLDTLNITNMAYMFNGCDALTFVDVSNFDTSNVTNMRGMFYECRKITFLDLSNFDTSNVTDMAYMFYNCDALTSLDLSNFDTSNVTDMVDMFHSCKALTTLDLSNFDTSKVENMTNMFYVCNKLTSLDVSNFDTANVTSMNAMFNACYNLTSLDVSNFDTSNVTDMAYMFYNCNALTSLDLGDFDTSNVRDMAYMFYNCGALTSLNLSNFDTSNVTSMRGMFNGSYNLASLDLSNFNTSNVTDMAYMFNACYNLASLDLSNFDTANVTDMAAMFYGCGELISLNVIGWPLDDYTQTAISSLPVGDDTKNEIHATVYFSVPSGWIIINPLDILSYTTNKSGVMPKFNSSFTKYSVNETDNGNETYRVTIAVDDLSKLPTSISFSDNKNLLTVERINTSNLTTMNSMFNNCNALTTLNVSNFVTSNVTDMAYMFNGCSKLASLDLSNFDTTNVEDMRYMFQNCSKLTSLDVSDFDTTNVTNMSHMFSGCDSLTSLDLSNFNTAKVTDMSYMFNYSPKLASLNLSNFDTSNVTDMAYMFYYCPKLTSLDVSNFVTSNVENMSNMFQNCSTLTSLDLSNFDTTNVKDMAGMFNKCNALMTLDVTGWSNNTYTQRAISSLPTGNDAKNEIYATVSFTVPSGWSLINSESMTMSLRQTDLDNLTDEEIAALVDEGWTIG